MTDLLVQFILFGVELLAHLLTAIAENIGQSLQRLLLPATDLGRMNGDSLFWRQRRQGSLMKLVTVDSARAIWLFETRELNPKGLDMNPIYLAIRNKYGFASPKTREETEEPRDGIKFQHGVYKPVGTQGISVASTIYPDGLIADTASSTQDAEAFLHDVIAQVQKHFHLVFSPEMVYKRRYVS